MIVLAAGARVTQVRFLPDGRLLVGTWAEGDAELLILPLPSGPRVVIPLSVRQVWDEPNRVAVSPTGDRLYTTFGALQIHSTIDGSVSPGGVNRAATQVIVSPDGERLITSYREQDGSTVTVGQSGGGAMRWVRNDPHPRWLNLAGFAPDGDRYLIVGPQHELLVRRFTHDAYESVVRYPSHHVNQAQVSPDGRHLGVIGYSSYYLYDTTTPLTKPRQIKGGQSFGNFVGFAFHPGGRTLAVIHGGPTLVKLYDLDTLTLRAKLNWKVGPLTCIAYSPDGQLAAVGTDDGRVVVWDADE